MFPKKRMNFFCTCLFSKNKTLLRAHLIREDKVKRCQQLKQRSPENLRKFSTSEKEWNGSVHRNHVLHGPIAWAGNWYALASDPRKRVRNAQGHSLKSVSGEGRSWFLNLKDKTVRDILPYLFLRYWKRCRSNNGFGDFLCNERTHLPFLLS